MFFVEAVRAAQHKALWQHFKLQPPFGKASVKFLSQQKKEVEAENGDVHKTSRAQVKMLMHYSSFNSKTICLYGYRTNKKHAKSLKDNLSTKGCTLPCKHVIYKKVTL